MLFWINRFSYESFFINYINVTVILLDLSPVPSSRVANYIYHLRDELKANPKNPLRNWWKVKCSEVQKQATRHIQGDLANGAYRGRPFKADRKIFIKNFVKKDFSCSNELLSFILFVILGLFFDTGAQGGRGGRGPFCPSPGPRPISPLCHCVERISKNLLCKFWRFNLVNSHYRLQKLVFSKSWISKIANSLRSNSAIS